MAHALIQTKPARKRVLIVEDDPEIASMLKRVLGREYDVGVCATGLDGVLNARKNKPDLLVLDVMLPGINGFGVATRVRAMPGLAKIPIVFVTAKDTAMDTIKGIQVGARHYIAKPFSISDVVGRVRKILTPHQA